MADYIYLIENRLSHDQQNALRHIRDVARDAGTLAFLTGGPVRDLTSGHAVRELEVVVHGNALKLKKPLEKLGAKVWGEDADFRTLYLCFPGTVRVDLVSAHRTEYPKPGKGVFHATSIQDDLRRRDFTVNAMAVSLNEGSYGLLMDPLNGAADIEARTLRLVSNYGFLEEPALLIRATRLAARLGWEMDEKTRQRYENAVAEDVIDSLSSTERSRELEQIGHEDDGLKVLRALDAAGWMKKLFPAWTPAKADEDKLNALHELAVGLLMQGVHPDMSAAQMQLLTAKLPGKDLGVLKRAMLRPGFVEEWNSLDAIAAGFSKVLLAKENQTPSTLYKLFTTYDPEAVLWLGFTSKAANVQEKYEQFLRVWPEVRQRIPHLQLQEMRITPELPTYASIVHEVFLKMIDGGLTTPEEIKAFLEPHAPPAPPPQPTYKRTRAKRGAEKVKERTFEEDEDGEVEVGDDDLDDLGGDDEEIELDLGKADLDESFDEEEGDEGEPDDETEEEEAPAPKRGKKAAAPAEKPAKKHEPAKPTAPAKPAKSEPVKAAKAAKPEPQKPAAKVAAKPAPAKAAPAKAKPAPAKAVKPAPKAAKAAAKPAVKAKATPVKAKAKPAPKPVAKKKPAPKPAAKKKPAKKR